MVFVSVFLPPPLLSYRAYSLCIETYSRTNEHMIRVTLIHLKALCSNYCQICIISNNNTRNQVWLREKSFKIIFLELCHSKSTFKNYFSFFFSSHVSCIAHDATNVKTYRMRYYTLFRTCCMKHYFRIQVEYFFSIETCSKNFPRENKDKEKLTRFPSSSIKWRILTKRYHLRYSRCSYSIYAIVCYKLQVVLFRISIMEVSAFKNVQISTLRKTVVSVSYTHLTLPTIYSV